MSCEGGTGHYISSVCTPGSPVVQAFGGDTDRAKAGLQEIFKRSVSAAERAAQGLGGNGAAAAPQSAALSRLSALRGSKEDQEAEDATLDIMGQLRDRYGYTPVIHGKSKNGLPLPKKTTQAGYLALARTLDAANKGAAMPAVAMKVIAEQISASTNGRTISGIGLNRANKLHCRNCGRFTPAQGSHLCPQTATPSTVARKLSRLLGIPASSYDDGALAAIIAQAQQGNVVMRHALTGEAVEVSLDGLSLALSGGFVPDTWHGVSALVTTDAGRVVPVTQVGSLNQVKLGGATSPVAAAAAAYGRALPAGTTVASATQLPIRSTQQVAQTATTQVAGGQGYDLGHFIGTEYRKTGSHGGAVRVGNWSFSVGQRLSDATHFSSARASGLEPAPKNGNVGVGRTLVEAVGILNDGKVVETADGKIEVYNDQGGLLAVYDPATNTAGDTDGNTNASPAQMAAVMAHRMLHPQNGFDAAMATDMIRFQNGPGSPVAVADGAYITFKNSVLANGGTLQLGGQLGTQKCQQCGQFMGSAHACPAAATSAPAAAPDAKAIAAEIVAAMPEARGMDAEALADALKTAAPQVNVNVDTTAIADAIRETPPPVIDSAALGGAIGAAMAQQGPGQTTLDPQAVAAALQVSQPQALSLNAAELAEALKAAQPNVTVQFDAEKLAEAIKAAQPNVTVQMDTDKLADALRSAQPQVNVTIDPAAVAAAVAAAVPQQPAAQVQLQLDGAQLADALKGSLAQVAPGASERAAATADMAELREALTQMASAMTQMAHARATGQPVGTPGNERCDQCGQFKGDNHTCPPAKPSPERKPWQGRKRPESLPLQATEHILSTVTLPAPDPYLLDIPANIGGQRDEALKADVPEIDPSYEVNAENERILKAMSAALQAGQRGSAKKSAWSRAFGLYGPPGTGKNTLLRQLAASIKTVDKDGNQAQGLNYAEVNITPNMTIAQAFGSVVLEPDPITGQTVSKVKLGKLGLALAMGSVVAVNEIVRNPKLATELQSVLEDGEIILTSPEAGMVKIPVHPASICALTWNPGNEGDPDRPASAPLSRIIPWRLDKASAKERARRAAGFFDQFDGGQGQDESDIAAGREKERQRILNEDYSIPKTFRPEPEEVDAAVELVADIERLAGGNGGMNREIGRRAGLTSTAPGDRQLRSFIFLGKTVGWREALEVFKISCDQDQNFNDQWNLIVERFEHHFGEDGNAPLRKAKQRATPAA